MYMRLLKALSGGKMEISSHLEKDEEICVIFVQKRVIVSCVQVLPY